jgi:hypothetical protein
VPKVKVYEPVLMCESKSKSNQKGKNEEINDGVAICHLDTMKQSVGHASYVALGHKPGQIEVFHWRFYLDFWIVLASSIGTIIVSAYRVLFLKLLFHK